MGREVRVAPVKRSHERRSLGTGAGMNFSGRASTPAAARGEAGGLQVVMDACIAATHSLLQVPPKVR